MDGVAEKIGQEQCDLLDRRGFVVIDNFFGRDTAMSFLTQIEHIYNMGLMEPNVVQFTTKDGPVQFPKPNIYEADLHNPRLRGAQGVFEELFTVCCDAIAIKITDFLPHFSLHTGPSSYTVKLQYNAGHGGCFPLHYDNPGRPNKRRVTCLCYLNPSWAPGDGGELQLIPFLGTPIAIEPLLDRLVLFQSDRVLHRVLPASRSRYCFTIWLDGNCNGDDDVLLKAKHLSATPQGLELLQMSGIQRVVSRAVYSEEYEVSLSECFKDGSPQACALMLASHRAHVDSLLRNPELQQFVTYLRASKAGAD